MSELNESAKRVHVSDLFLDNNNVSWKYRSNYGGLLSSHCNSSTFGGHETVECKFIISLTHSRNIFAAFCMTTFLGY